MVKEKEILKVIWNHPLGLMDVCTKFCSNPPDMCENFDRFIPVGYVNHVNTITLNWLKF